MALEKGFLVFLLISTLSVAILQAAPQQKADPEKASPEMRQQPEVQSPPAGPAGGTPAGGTPAEGATPSATPDKPANPTDSKPVEPTGSKPAELPAELLDTSSQKPVKPSETQKPPKDDEETMADEALNNCWTCLLEAAEDLCSYLLDWTAPGKISTNLFSFFQGRSSEESDETTEKPSSSPLMAFSNLYRFRRSSPRSRRSIAVPDVSLQGLLLPGVPTQGVPPLDIPPLSVPTQGVPTQGVPTQDVPNQGIPTQSVTFQGVPNQGNVAQNIFGFIPPEGSEFLDLVNSFYVKMRDRFLRERPGTLSRTRSTADLYRRPYEIADVAAYFLGVPRDRLVQVYERLKTRDIGSILLQALDYRMALLNGAQRTVDLKSFGSLTPTSISYFFKELFASVNGIATGFSELLGIVLENEATPSQPNTIVK